MRDLLLVVAFLLSMLNFWGGVFRESAPDPGVDALALRLETQEAELQQVRADSWRVLTALDGYRQATDAQLAVLRRWSNEIVALLTPPVGQAAADYDCDDATLDAFRFYTERGYPVCVLAGNLALEGESPYRVNHVWLLVRFEGGWLPVDWGAPAYDRQHFEGYRLTERELLLEVAADAS